MRSLAVSVVCVLSCGCGGLAEALATSLVDTLGGFSVYDPPAEVVNASRLAFVTSDDGEVVCYILDGGTSDPVATVPAKPNGIAAGASGALFITTEDRVWGLSSNWNEVEGLDVNSDIVRIDGVAADAGTVVVAVSTEEGAVVRVYDEMSRALVGSSAPVPGVTITSLAVADGRAFAVESPSGEIVSYDLETGTPARVPLAGSDATSGEPVGLVVGHTGNLFVASADARIVEEIDIATGAPLGTIFSGGLFLQPAGLAFDAESERYLLLGAAGSILEFDNSGDIVAMHESGLVRDATAVTFVGR